MAEAKIEWELMRRRWVGAKAEDEITKGKGEKEAVPTKG